MAAPKIALDDLNHCIYLTRCSCTAENLAGKIIKSWAPCIHRLNVTCHTHVTKGSVGCRLNHTPGIVCIGPFCETCRPSLWMNAANCANRCRTVRCSATDPVASVRTAMLASAGCCSKQTVSGHRGVLQSADPGCHWQGCLQLRLQCSQHRQPIDPGRLWVVSQSTHQTPPSVCHVVFALCDLSAFWAHKYVPIVLIKLVEYAQAWF